MTAWSPSLSLKGFTNFTNSGGHGTLHGMTFGIRTQRLLHLPIPRHPLPTDEGQRRDRNVLLFKDFLISANAAISF